jgi:hypothetical protein
MVITNLIGGLGNQMFQYAVGRALSLRYGVPLRLDVSDFSWYGLHQGFELQRIFNCTEEIATKVDMRRVLSWQFFPGIRRLLLKPSMALFRSKEFVVEPYFRYWEEIENIPSSCYITGYWQSEKYFSEFSHQIRKNFSFREPLNRDNDEIANRMTRVNAVSLHVRRGDFVNNPTTMATHGLCSPDYYRKAIQYIAYRVSQPHFFIFSDDISWVKENLEIGFPCQYVDHNQGAESHNDMRLMSLCQHHIIANSSFSWWGAWLNPSDEKIVVAPKRWFAKQIDTRDLLPPGWVSL